MAKYLLTARHEREVETVVIEAFSDADAIANASFKVMELAYPNVALWAKGEIELSDTAGVILQSMAAK